MPWSYPTGRRPRLQTPAATCKSGGAAWEAPQTTQPPASPAQGAFPLTIHGVHSLPPRSETQGWPP